MAIVVHVLDVTLSSHIHYNPYYILITLYHQCSVYTRETTSFSFGNVFVFLLEVVVGD